MFPLLLHFGTSVQQALYLLKFRLVLVKLDDAQGNVRVIIWQTVSGTVAPLLWLLLFLEGFTRLSRKLLYIVKPAGKGESIYTV